MAKHPTYPTLYDGLKTINISFLKSHQYLEDKVYKGGTITWSRNGHETGSVSIKVNTQSETPYLELEYKYDQSLINYRVQLVSIPSNLGKGVVWFFICPHTGKRCRKLYFAGTYFYHRSAFRGCMYEKQTLSKKNRQLDNLMRAYFYNDQLYKKHFKKQYAGKPTKRYLRLKKQLIKAQMIPFTKLSKYLGLNKTVIK